MKKENVICYHHNDLDGIVAAAIVKKVFQQADLVSINYGDDFTFIRKDHNNFDIVVVVDFSFPEEIMNEMASSHGAQFCWIDHHESAKEKLKDLWDSDKIDGLRSIEKAGCELTWDWFFPHEECPMLIQHVGDRDMWEFELENTKEICEALHYSAKDPADFLEALNNLDYKNLIKTGKILLESKDIRCKSVFKKGKKCCLRFSPDPDKKAFYDNCYLINTNTDISDSCSYAIEQGYKIAINFSYIKDSWIVNLRSKDIDVSEIATNYGGGGHKGASGFTYEGDIFEILKEK